MNHRGIASLLAVAVWGVLAVTAAAHAGQDPQAASRFISEYRIGPQDELDIRVAKSDLFSLKVRVSEKGTINIPYLGEIAADGLTAAELEKVLAKALIDKEQMLDPQVSVTITDRVSKRVMVIGAVTKPGPYELMGRQTLLQILSTAGGISRDAGREITVIRRLADGTSSSLHIPVENLIVKGETQYDIPIEAGDIINVQVDRSGSVYVLGEVKTPGALAVLQSRLPTVTQAIAQAGGYTDRAALGRVVIKRRDAAGQEKEIVVDVKAILKGKAKDVPLLDGDTIYVPKGLF